MHLYACCTEQFGTVEALGGGVTVFARQQFTDVTERILGRSLTAYQLGETRHEEVVGEFLDAADRQLGTLATQRACELAVVRISTTTAASSLLSLSSSSSSSSSPAAIYYKFRKSLRINAMYTSGMGTRRKSSRPRRDRDAHLPRPRQDRDVGSSRDETLKFRDETDTRRM